MPYPGVPKSKEKEMERCVSNVMSDGESKSSAIAICHESIMGKDSQKMEKNMDSSNFYIPFSKKNEEEKMVYGYASTEVVDSQGEVVEKKAISDALPEYMKYANIREMHQPSAVGKTKQASMDETGLFIKVKVVDDTAWEKVKEGVYNGFSIGGSVVLKDGNRIKALDLKEISLVDRPANPKALFTAVKFDGTLEKSPDNMVAIDINEDKAEALSEIQAFTERQIGVAEVHNILMLARELMYMITDRIWEGKEYKDLEEAINNLKIASKAILGEGSVDKIDSMIADVKKSKEIFDDNSNFAYIKSDTVKELPIATLELCSKSIGKFRETVFSSQDLKILAARILKSAATQYEIDTNRYVEEESEKKMMVEIQKSYLPKVSKTE